MKREIMIAFWGFFAVINIAMFPLFRGGKMNTPQGKAAWDTGMLCSLGMVISSMLVT